MIDLTIINEWQRRDDDGLVEPWYTFPALDEIKTWDLSNKSVLEIGGGASTIWWNRRAKEVRTIETNEYYAKPLTEMGFDVISSFPNPMNYYDIVIVDNEGDRDANILNAFIAANMGGIIIIDNYDQESMDWKPSEEIKEFLETFKCKIYKQPNHRDWQTLICWL